MSIVNRDAQSRYLGLDGLRGLCALGVIIFHHKHFAFVKPNVFDESILPFKPLLTPLYDHGLLLVEVFFILSGFIFHRLYAARLRPNALKPLSNTDFWAARLARLYPLYLITLIVAALLLSASQALLGQRFVYEEDSLIAFGQSLLMIQQWQPFAVHSFNGPNWSLSVEILLYALFFITARLGLTSPLNLLGLFLISIVIQVILGKAWFDLARGPPAFFLGGLLSVISLKSSFMNMIDRYQKPLLISFGLGLSLLILTLYWPKLVQSTAIATLANSYGFLYGLIPLLILLSLSQNSLIDHALAPLKRLGDISYSLYLWHFPIQCVFFIAISKIWPENSHLILMSPIFLIVMIGLTLIFAGLSFDHIEKPLQKWILNRLSPNKP